jgi:peptidoglycan-N-acetylglucosamine deacetylase
VLRRGPGGKRPRLAAPGRAATLSLALVLGLFATLSLASAPPARPASIEYPPGYYSEDPLPDHVAYLTFDDGPSAFEPDFLDVLAKEGVRASFFVNSWHSWLIDKDPEFVRSRVDSLARLIGEGHALGNHTSDHKEFSLFLGPQGAVRELDALDAEFAKSFASGIPDGPEGPPDFVSVGGRLLLARPPGGRPWDTKGSAEERALAGSALYGSRLNVMWTAAWDSLDSRSWVKGEWLDPKSPLYDPGTKEFSAKADQLAKRILGVADMMGGRGAVILFHETHPTSLAALPRIIQGLRDRGYRFGTVVELLKWKYGDSVFASMGSLAGLRAVANAGRGTLPLGWSAIPRPR